MNPTDEQFKQGTKTTIKEYPTILFLYMADHHK